MKRGGFIGGRGVLYACIGEPVGLKRIETRSIVSGVSIYQLNEHKEHIKDNDILPAI